MGPRATSAVNPSDDQDDERDPARLEAQLDRRGLPPFRSKPPRGHPPAQKYIATATSPSHASATTKDDFADGGHRASWKI